MPSKLTRSPQRGRRDATRPELIWSEKRKARPAIPDGPLVLREAYGGADGGEGEKGGNKLVHADNRRAMTALRAACAGSVDLVYLDPPFATGGSFSARAGEEELHAYDDRWEDGIGAYLSVLLEQLELCHTLLSPHGTVFLHCDWRTSHLVRCLLDEVFGAAAFKNEIVWRYRRWPAKTRAFQRMHDVLFWYGKSSGDGHAWTPLYEELSPSTRKTWGTKRQIADFSSGRRKPSQTSEETPGAPMSDVWDIGIIAPIAHERLGYPTQKPEALLKRVIEAASRPGDVVADFFAGSGTTLAVAARLGRRFIGCDVGRLAIHTTRKRLLGLGRAEDRASPLVFEVLADEEPPRPTSQKLVAAKAGPDGRRETRLSLTEAAGDVDLWAVDWAFDGRVFRAGFHAARGRRGEPLAREAVHVYPEAGCRTVAVQIFDQAGNEIRQLLTVNVG